MFCHEGMTMTYGSPDRIDGTTTYGGFSKHPDVREESASPCRRASTFRERRHQCTVSLLKAGSLRRHDLRLLAQQ
jgi:hypothetical protein